MIAEKKEVCKFPWREENLRLKRFKGRMDILLKSFDKSESVVCDIKGVILDERGQVHGVTHPFGLIGMVALEVCGVGHPPADGCEVISLSARYLGIENSRQSSRKILMPVKIQ